MPRWDRRLRMILDWTVALLFRPDVTKVDLVPVRDRTPQENGHFGPKDADHESVVLR